MGERGPVSRPTPLKILRGEKNASRLNRNPPKPRDRAPTMPGDLSDEAKHVWRRVMLELGPAKVITAADGDVLRVYCEATSRYTAAARMLELDGPLIEGANGRIKHPLHQIVRDNALLMRLFGRELGLTPSAREGLHARGTDSGDPLDAWLAKADER